MANPHKGEVSFEAQGKIFVLKLGTNTLRAIEKREGMPFPKFFARKPEEWGIDQIHSIFYCGLYKQYELTEEQVGDLIDELGHQKTGEILMELIASAFKTEVATSNENPPMVRKLHGIGTG